MLTNAESFDEEGVTLTFYKATALKILENSDEDEGTDHASFVEAQKLENFDGGALYGRGGILSSKKIAI